MDTGEALAGGCHERDDEWKSRPPTSSSPPFAGQIADHEGDERQPALESPFASLFAESSGLEGEEVTESPYLEDSVDTLDEVAYGPQPEADSEIIEPDERRLVNNTLAVPYRWICSLDVTYAKRNTLSRGTGLLIGPLHVLTAAHNIYRPYGTGLLSVRTRCRRETAAPARSAGSRRSRTPRRAHSSRPAAPAGSTSHSSPSRKTSPPSNTGRSATRRSGIGVTRRSDTGRSCER